ncbi:NUDIX family hydrolase [Natronomonas pharaonis DSM 2160]|uniref:NUDIX family hydrolase n=1 Tax=Natronomonas pharaonis (strain ATCC 35678 / DSM 2160 / CIP 103997 / JCM 8858 / NBRC 14720 / NCIMB 2260 / Gabara) TaxID=348780 RepID=A0A1U7EWW8_NATPD|nr:NUDIX hydrolase [Natronomonas pharaonis]CAI49618.1 NUDIX family hydrolase [Natronomonas pharaonis DSM 2160]
MDKDALAWETLASERDYTCPGFDVIRDDVRLPNGTETEFHYVSEPPSVVILPFRPDGDVVVIEEWRQAVGRVSYGLPAGGLETDDEDVIAAAHRELAEETGYEADAIEQLGTYEPANGLFDSVFHYVVAHGCRPTAEQQLDDNESITVETASFDDLRDRAAVGDLRDGRTALGVLQYAVRKDS